MVVEASCREVADRLANLRSVRGKLCAKFAICAHIFRDLPIDQALVVLLNCTALCCVIQLSATQPNFRLE